MTAQSLLRQHVETPPSAFGYLFTCWTMVTLCAHLATSFGLQLSEATVRRALLTLEYRWRRPRHELPKDPEATTKLLILPQRLPSPALAWIRSETARGRGRGGVCNGGDPFLLPTYRTIPLWHALC